MHLKYLGSEKTTEISIGEKLLQSPAFLSYLKKTASRFALITDSHIKELYGLKIIEESGCQVDVFSFPAGERHKTRETIAFLQDRMLSQGIGRDGAIIALGGGVVTDVAGFIASTYCRGIPLISIPTSLLAMVDAAIGGKNGVNTPKGKNLIGTFYHPKAVFIDTHMLSTLPEREMRNGYAEIIKHALIASPALFSLLEQGQISLEEIIYQSCQIKKMVIEEDVQEKGMRRMLNFGHTIGHALETLEDYRLPHGEAIAIGMIVEGYISHALGHLKKEDLDRMISLFKQYGFPLTISSAVTTDKMIEAMALDKKSLFSTPRFVLLKSIGEVDPSDGHYCSKVPSDLLISALNWMQEQYRGEK